MNLLCDYATYEQYRKKDDLTCCVDEETLIEANIIVQSWIFSYCHNHVKSEIVEAVIMLADDLLKYREDENGFIAQRRSYNYLLNCGLLNRNANVNCLDCGCKCE